MCPSEYSSFATIALPSFWKPRTSVRWQRSCTASQCRPGLSASIESCEADVRSNKNKDVRIHLRRELRKKRPHRSARRQGRSEDSARGARTVSKKIPEEAQNRGGPRCRLSVAEEKTN